MVVSSSKDKDREQKERDATADTGSCGAGGGNKTYGRGATMPVLATDVYADVELPDLKEFSLDDIKTDSTLIFIGKRRTGKSYLMRNILYHLRKKIPAGIVISQTSSVNHFWQQYVPAKYVYDSYAPELLDAVFKRQRAIINSKNLTDKEKEEKAPFFVLLDDVISDRRLQFDKNLLELFVSGRHFKIFTLISSQYAKGVITPTIRSNSDLCFMFKTIQKVQRDSLWEDYGDFLTRAAWDAIMDAYTEDQEVLCCDTDPDIRMDSWVEQGLLTWFKAINPDETDPGWKMGSKEYHESAWQGDNPIPPKGAPESSGDMLTVDDLMPAPWNQIV